MHPAATPLLVTTCADEAQSTWITLGAMYMSSVTPSTRAGIPESIALARRRSRGTFSKHLARSPIAATVWQPLAAAIASSIDASKIASTEPLPSPA